MDGKLLTATDGDVSRSRLLLIFFLMCNITAATALHPGGSRFQLPDVPISLKLASLDLLARGLFLTNQGSSLGPSSKVLGFAKAVCFPLFSQLKELEHPQVITSYCWTLWSSFHSPYLYSIDIYYWFASTFFVVKELVIMLFHMFYFIIILWTGQLKTDSSYLLIYLLYLCI